MRKSIIFLLIISIVALFVISGCSKTVGQRIGSTPEVESELPVYTCSISGCSGSPPSDSITCVSSVGTVWTGCQCSCNGPGDSAICSCSGYLVLG